MVANPSDCRRASKPVEGFSPLCIFAALGIKTCGGGLLLRCNLGRTCKLHMQPPFLTSNKGLLTQSSSDCNNQTSSHYYQGNIDFGTKWKWARVVDESSQVGRELINLTSQATTHSIWPLTANSEQMEWRSQGRERRIWRGGECEDGSRRCCDRRQPQL